MVHGGIDGFSRLVTFMYASSNNRVETVGNLFIKATETYGIPFRVRMDFGGENEDVVTLMTNFRGQGRGSAIQGRSVYNQRIERLWGEVWKDVAHNFYECFTYPHPATKK